jgi:hypothetical protein
MAFRLTRQADRRLIPWIAASFLLPIAALMIVAGVTGDYLLYPVVGVLLGLLGAVSTFGRRAQRANMAAMDGKLGAALAIVNNTPGTWLITEAVQFNRHQDVVHRVIGRCGVVLIGEGNSRGARELMINEKRRVGRVVGDTPVYDMVVGNGPDDIALTKLRSKLAKLPRALSKTQVSALDRRLRALSGPAPMPIPKGPMPTRVPRGKVR